MLRLFLFSDLPMKDDADCLRVHCPTLLPVQEAMIGEIGRIRDHVFLDTMLDALAVLLGIDFPNYEYFEMEKIC